MNFASKRKPTNTGTKPKYLNTSQKFSPTNKVNYAMEIKEEAIEISNLSLNQLRKVNSYLNEKNLKRMENIEKLISKMSSEDIKKVLKFQYKLLSEKQRRYFIASNNPEYKETQQDLQKLTINNLAFGDECWISAYKDEIIDSLNKYQIIIIKGESGFGKSTRIPLYAYEINGFNQGKIASCQPYNINVLSLTSYMSNYYGKKLNLKVGYSLGKESNVNSETVIVYTNCRNLLQESIRSPYLTKYFCVIIDEQFLQSVEADLLLLKMKEIIQQRPYFKLIIINPSFDIIEFKSYFKDKQDAVTFISLPSLTFPVKVVYNNLRHKTKYLEKCAKLTNFINDNKSDGNILIFLPTVKEMEQCCKIVKSSLKDRVECHILHNMMSQQEISELYAVSKVKRKIIFANQCAESLWLPNISYVIDSGKLKEDRYQLEKESSTGMSKMNSERRKCLVGWSIRNCCYRIYTSDTFKTMLERPVLNTLKLEPSQLLLTLYHYEVSNPIDATFISLLDNEHIKVGLHKLKKSKAIKGNSLTILGEDMSNYMPMKTQHAKLIALSTEMGVKFEAVVIHVISSLKNPIFMTTGESKDIGKLKFYDSYGDYFALLNVYFNWKEQVNKENWCKENGINHAAVTYLDKKVNDTCNVFKIQPKAHLSNRDVLYKIICECFVDNLCIYSGHFKLGYQSAESGKILHIHRSSILLHKTDQIEKFVMYDDVIKHGNNIYMINVTPVSDMMLKKLIYMNYIQNEVTQIKKLVTLEIFSLGTVLLNEFLLEDRKHLTTLENTIKTQVECDTVIVDPCLESDSISIYTYPEYISKASSFLSDYLKNFSNKVRTKEEIMTVKLGHLNMNVQMTRGAVIKDINFLTVKNKEEELISERQDSQLILKYQYSINLSWQRRYCRGEGFVTFNSFDDFALAQTYLTSQPIEIDGINVKISESRKEKNQFYIKGLTSKTTNKSLKESIENILPQEIQVKEASVVLISEFTTTTEDIELIKQSLLLQFIGYINGDMDVEMTNPNCSDAKMRAYLNFNDDKDIPLIMDAIKKDNIKFEDLTLNAVPVYRMSVICPCNQYKYIKSNINERLFQDMENKLKLKENWASDTVFLIFLSNNYKTMKFVESVITTELNGKLLENLTLGQSRKLFSHSGRQWLKQASKATETFIIQDFKQKTIRICGKTENYEKVKLKIEDYLKNSESEVTSVINIDQSDILNRSVIKALIQKYGVACEGFLEKFQLSSIDLNIQHGQMTLCGLPKFIVDAVNYLKTMSTSSTSAEPGKDCCPVCFMVPISGLSYRLEFCGHQYCSDCIKLLISERNIPLICCKENCGKELVIDDIQNILDNDEEETRKLLNSSVRAYVKENYRKKRFCPSPDCEMIYNIASSVENAAWTCPLCDKTICSLCGYKIHSGMSCEMAAEIQKDQDFSLKVWMEKDPQQRKICPSSSCHSPIEKYTGCNHVTCWKCRCHMCWLCLQIFPDGNAVYNHLPYCIRNQQPFA